MKSVDVQLFGSEHIRSVAIPNRSSKRSIPPTAPTDSEIIRKHQQAVFASLRDLKPRFSEVGITGADYWAMVHSEFGVQSRTELSASELCRLSATLNAARRHSDIFTRLVAKVKSHIADSVPVTDASSLVFANPEDTFSDTCFVIRKHRTDGTRKVIYIGEYSDGIKGRCQSHADKTRCIVFLYHNGQPPEPFYPSLEVSPV